MQPIRCLVSKFEVDVFTPQLELCEICPTPSPGTGPAQVLSQSLSRANIQERYLSTIIHLYIPVFGSHIFSTDGSVLLLHSQGTHVNRFSGGE